MPVMEGKAVLYKKFGDVDAVPICIDTKDPKEFVNIVEKLQPSFGGINLEDISSPKCYEIEAELIKRVRSPVFHDDQHGTAIIASRRHRRGPALCEEGHRQGQSRGERLRRCRFRHR